MRRSVGSGILCAVGTGSKGLRRSNPLKWSFTTASRRPRLRTPLCSPRCGPSVPPTRPMHGISSGSPSAVLVAGQMRSTHMIARRRSTQSTPSLSSTAVLHSSNLDVSTTHKCSSMQRLRKTQKTSTHSSPRHSFCRSVSGTTKHCACLRYCPDTSNSIVMRSSKWPSATKLLNNSPKLPPSTTHSSMQSHTNPMRGSTKA